MCPPMCCGEKTKVLVTDHRMDVSGSHIPYPFCNLYVNICCCMGLPLLLRENMERTYDLKEIKAIEFGTNACFPNFCPSTFTVVTPHRTDVLELKWGEGGHAARLKAVLVAMGLFAGKKGVAAPSATVSSWPLTQ